MAVSAHLAVKTLLTESLATGGNQQQAIAQSSNPSFTATPKAQRTEILRRLEDLFVDKWPEKVQV
jgi:hypothetical protein